MRQSFMHFGPVMLLVLLATRLVESSTITSPAGAERLVPMVRRFSLPDFDPDRFKRSWSHFYEDQAGIREDDPVRWRSEIDAVVVGAILSNSSTALRAVLEIRVPGTDNIPMFSANRALVKAAKSHRVSDDAAAKLVRVALEFGASPFQKGIVKGKRFADLTAVEIAIMRRKRLTVEALLSAPSPASSESLAELVQLHPELQRGVEVFRTRLARSYSPVKVSTRREESGPKTFKAMLDGGVYTFAESYLSALLMLLAYLTFVVTLMSLMFQLRVKQVPNPEILLTARQDPTWWGLLYVTISTIATTVPVSNPLEIAGLGLAWLGGVLWSQLRTNRIDLALLLILAGLGQTFLTVTCYLSFAPLASLDSASGKHVDKLMTYPKEADWNRVIANSAYLVGACSVAYFVLFVGLQPVTRMYACHTASVSDTYGFEFSLTRTVATIWDVLIFFSLALRVYRTFTTVAAFDLIGRISSQSPPADLADDIPGA